MNRRWGTRIMHAILIMGGIAAGAYFSNRSLLDHDIQHHTLGVECKQMNHGDREVANDSLIPAIKKIVVSKDPMSGWNIWFETDNFTFTPENASKMNRKGQGHAHLMVNGVKRARLYGEWFHIPALEKGKNVIEVSLNSNLHEVLTFYGVPIKKKVCLTID